MLVDDSPPLARVQALVARIEEMADKRCSPSETLPSTKVTSECRFSEFSFCSPLSKQPGSPSTVSNTSVSSFGPLLLLPTLPITEHASMGHWLEPDSAIDSVSEASIDSAEDSQSCAAIKIQAVFRSWYIRLKFRVSQLEKRLERSLQRKENALQWIETRKKCEMERYATQMAMIEETQTNRNKSVIAKAHEIMEQLRSQNRMIRGENKKLEERNNDQLEEHLKLGHQFDAYVVSSKIIKEHLIRLHAEHKVVADTAVMFDKRITEYRKCIAHWDECLAFEKKIRRSHKRLIQDIVKGVKQADEEYTFKRQMCSSIGDMLKSNAKLRRQLRFEASLNLKRAKDNEERRESSESRPKTESSEV